MTKARTPRLPPSLATNFSDCVYAAERCLAAYQGIEGMAEVTRRAHECATLCRAAASMLAIEALLGAEVARLAVASCLLCEEACALQSEPLCAQCIDACRDCSAAYRRVAYGVGQDNAGAPVFAEAKTGAHRAP